MFFRLTFDQPPDGFLVLDVGHDAEVRLPVVDSREAEVRGDVEALGVRDSGIDRVHVDDVDLTWTAVTGHRLKNKAHDEIRSDDMFEIQS